MSTTPGPLAAESSRPGIGLREATREVEDERERSSFAIRKLTHGDLDAAPLDEEARRGLVADAQVRVAGEEAADGLLEGVEHAGRARRLRSERRLRAHPRRELAKAQLPSRESLGERGGVPPFAADFVGARSEGTARRVENSTASGRRTFLPSAAGGLSPTKADFAGVADSLLTRQPFFAGLRDSFLARLMDDVGVRLVGQSHLRLDGERIGARADIRAGEAVQRPLQAVDVAGDGREAHRK